ncbi:hypothetical protein [Luteolibacter sp. LG18]|uniref:hypothetical protein n=1 Tax=Luteolibacter sp. LG18 TaxID=2819286 RepID=UPI002B28FBD1|nr:hypothetical protein llg_07380 [Luteolibacter sp. LG18]BCU79633.1 hypothetical protein llg_43480 [Luteolibacter sp. LG18]
MSAKRKPKQQPLFEDEADPWTVKVAVVKDRKKTEGTIDYDGLHKLLYRRVVIDRGTGRIYLAKIEAQARHFNLRNATPETRTKGEDTTGNLI